jgi:hypothetical protein
MTFVQIVITKTEMFTKKPSLYAGQSGQSGAHVQPPVIMAQNTGPGNVTILPQPLVGKNVLDQEWTSKTVILINVQVFLI